jgi:integrase
LLWELSEFDTAAIVSPVGYSIGKAAGIVAYTDATTGQVKYASLHDFRRAFGRRWAERLRSQQLMELMRHESINTTMDYYVGRDAEATAKILWEVDRF